MMITLLTILSVLKGVVITLLAIIALFVLISLLSVKFRAMLLVETELLKIRMQQEAERIRQHREDETE